MIKIYSTLKQNKFLVIALALIFLLAAGIRIGLIIIHTGPDPYYGMITPMGDAARNLAEGRGYVYDLEYTNAVMSRIEKENKMIDIQDSPPPPHEHFTPYYLLPPGTSAMLAVTFLIFGQNRYIYLQYIQAIIDSFGCLLIFLVGKEIFSRRIGLISAFLYAVFIPIAYWSTWPLHDALMPFITLLALYLFILGVRRKSMKFYALSGLVIGIGCYFQPTIMLLPVAFGLGLLIYNLRKQDIGIQIAYAAKMTAIMIAVVILVISPWVVRNYRVTGSVILMRPGIWSGIWEGFGEFGENPAGAQFSDEAAIELARKELGDDVEYLSPQYQAFFKTKVINTVAKYHGWWLNILVKRIPKVMFLRSDFQVNTAFNILLDKGFPNRTISEMIKNSSLWKFINERPCSIFYIMVLLSVFGIWVQRRNWRLLALILTVTVCFAAVHIVMFTSTKSMLPESIGYIILSAIALDYFYARIKDRVISGDRHLRMVE